jgi:transposase-like protein
MSFIHITLDEKELPEILQPFLKKIFPSLKEDTKIGVDIDAGIINIDFDIELNLPSSTSKEAPTPATNGSQGTKMGRPKSTPGSLGLTCPKCGSDDVTRGGYGPNHETRIRCKACGSQPTLPEPPSSSPTSSENVLVLPLCPDCSSKDVVKFGVRVMPEGDIQNYKCKACNRKFSEKYKEIDEKAKAEAIRLYEMGISCRRIEKELVKLGFDKYTHTTIWRWCQGEQASTHEKITYDDIKWTPELDKRIQECSSSVKLSAVMRDEGQVVPWQCINKRKRVLSKEKNVVEVQKSTLNVAEIRGSTSNVEPESGLGEELNARIMELYKTTNAKEISEILDAEGFFLTPKEVNQRIRTIQLREIALKTGATKSIDPPLPDKGRDWKNDEDISERHIPDPDEHDTSDFGQQGIEAMGVEQAEE